MSVMKGGWFDTGKKSRLDSAWDANHMESVRLVGISRVFNI